MVNQRDLSEAAALIARHADLIIDRDRPLETERVEEYWVASRRRWKAWSDRPCPDFATGATLAEEIMVSEMATRVWTAIYYVHCVNHPNSEGLRLVRQGLHWHVQVRQAVIENLIDNYSRTEISGLLRLDRLRRRVERWTDFLIGTITRHGVALNVAFDPDRCRNNSQAVVNERLSDAVWPLTVAGLTRSFPVTPLLDDESAQHEAAVLKALLGAFPGDAFLTTSRTLSPFQRVVRNVLDCVPPGPN